MKNAEISARKNDAISRGVGMTTQIYAEKAENSEIWDVEGNRYIDFAGGIAVLNTGHRHPKVIEAVKAQLDRFMLKTHVGYPTPEEEMEIVTRMTSEVRPGVEPVLNAEKILSARKLITQIYLDDKIKRYIVDLVVATREPERYRLDMKHLIRAGASPRGSQKSPATMKPGRKPSPLRARRGSCCRT